jgi:DNA replication protein DnaC
MSAPPRQADPQAAIIGTYLKQLKLPAIAREYLTLARDAERQNAGYLGYLRTLLEHEVIEREERQLQRRLAQARFPYEKRLSVWRTSTSLCSRRCARSASSR